LQDERGWGTKLQMTFTPIFPTELHQQTAELIRDYFLNISNVDTVLVVNSCARGQAVPESDLDFAVLVKPEATPPEIKNIEAALLDKHTSSL
jgi:predicted nucleotidyltransferase